MIFWRSDDEYLAYMAGFSIENGTLANGPLFLAPCEKNEPGVCLAIRRDIGTVISRLSFISIVFHDW
jgi:hypothetical protein